MISSINELYRILKIEEGLYLKSFFLSWFINTFLKCENTILYKFVKLMRITGYFATNKNRNILYRLIYLCCLREYNSKCLKYGLLIGEGCFGEGLLIYHTGNIVVNGMCRIGKNCRLHGSNCIGNSKYDTDSPTLGDNVSLGVGAKVFGKIFIADDVTIAAGAVVTKSCYEKGVILAGIPAKIIGKKHV